jgi:hypothetical protein
MRAAWHRSGSLSLIASGLVGYALWEWFRPETINGFQAFGCAGAAVMFGLFWLLVARAIGRLEARRPPHRFCSHCGSDLTGSFSRICQKCGMRVDG